jgi:hypothetical protein
MTRDSILMARRKSKRSPRRKFTGVAVLPALEAYVQTSIWTEAALGVNPIEFFTGYTMADGGYKGGFNPGSDGGQRITLPELLGVGVGGVGGNFGSYAKDLPDAIKKNMGGIEGVIMTGLKSAGVGIGFRLVNKMTRKARSGLNRQILTPLGVSSMIKI